SATLGGLCHKASARPLTRPSRLSATRLTDNYLGGTSTHWRSAPLGRTQHSRYQRVTTFVFCDIPAFPPAVESGPFVFSRVEGGRGSDSGVTPVPTPAHRTGRADFPHPALRQGSPPDSRGSRIPVPPSPCGTASSEASGSCSVFPGSSPITAPGLLRKRS